LKRHILLAVTCAFLCFAPANADELATSARRSRTQEFHWRAQQRAGVLVPMYVYPANVHTNEAYNRLIEIRRQFETVPIWVIVNPASGPGEKADANYTKAIDRLHGAGCVVLGYVSTSYGKRPAAQVKGDLDKWLGIYPRIEGVFFDEMIYEDNEAAASYQASLNRHAHDAGLWPTVANPGADTPGRYFQTEAADVIVIHEGGAWPSEERLHGDYFGGYADYPPFTRAVLVHSAEYLDRQSLAMARKYARWFYVTEGEFRANDPAVANPWDRLSKHMEELCKELAGK
jgi:hypothetical protein